MNSTQAIRAVQDNIARVIKGKPHVIEMTLVALLARGHLLLEDVPGVGKTTLAHSLARSLDCSFKRIQFTSDLLPSDIVGVSIFNRQKQAFEFMPGPIFANIVLADEINRTSPKVQSAMLEAMAEKQITVDDRSYPLDELFFVIATQNPLDLAGTYPLPRPQLDRFLFKIRMTHIARSDELQVLAEYPVPRLQRAQELPGVTRAELLAARTALRSGVAIHPSMREALVDLAGLLRDELRLVNGVSTRSLMLLLPALQARALAKGRDYVSPDDLETLSPFVFQHRVEPAPGIDDVDAVVREAVKKQVERLARLSLTR